MTDDKSMKLDICGFEEGHQGPWMAVSKIALLLFSIGKGHSTSPHETRLVNVNSDQYANKSMRGIREVYAYLEGY